MQVTLEPASLAVWFGWHDGLGCYCYQGHSGTYYPDMGEVTFNSDGSYCVPVP